MPMMHWMGNILPSESLLKLEPCTAILFNSADGPGRSRLQIHVDRCCCFLRQSVAQIYNQSELNECLEDRSNELPPYSPLPNDVKDFPYALLRDDNCVLCPYLMKPYSGCHLTKEDRIANYRISGTNVSEWARWFVLEDCLTKLRFCKPMSVRVYGNNLRPPLSHWRLFHKQVKTIPPLKQILLPTGLEHGTLRCCMHRN